MVQPTICNTLINLIRTSWGSLPLFCSTFLDPDFSLWKSGPSPFVLGVSWQNSACWQLGQCVLHLHTWHFCPSTLAQSELILSVSNRRCVCVIFRFQQWRNIIMRGAVALMKPSRNWCCQEWSAFHGEQMIWEMVPCAFDQSQMELMSGVNCFICSLFVCVLPC